jgi:PPOX class probable F420-dependent enzyme
MSVRLDDEEVRELLASSHTGILTTLRADGSPITLPMWFVFLDGAVYLQTPARTRKTARIRRDGRVAFLVESGERWAELKAVHLSGHAELIDDAAERDRVAAALHAKYAAFRTPRERYPTATRDHYAGERATIRIVVATARILSWDNAKIRLRQG